MWESFVLVVAVLVVVLVLGFSEWANDEDEKRTAQAPGGLGLYRARGVYARPWEDDAREEEKDNEDEG